MQTDDKPAQAVLVMGVCGSGKSTLGRLLAASLRAEFVEADLFHSTANIERMRAGIALTDADRADWLQALNRALLINFAHGRSQVLACSALKEAYRKQLGEGLPQLRIIFLDGPREILEARLAVRHQHFMPASLLGSQLEILERPVCQSGTALTPCQIGLEKPVERPACQHGTVLTLSLSLSPAEALATAIDWLKS